MSVPAFLSLSFASDDEVRLIESLLARLRAVNVANAEAEKRYEGSWQAQQFGISIPPNMRGLKTPAGWDGTVVDVLEERLDWLGWTSDGDDYGLSGVFAANGLDVDSGMAHLDSLIFGVSFVSVGSGFQGEPHPLVATHSPMEMTATFDRRTRRLSSALDSVTENGQVTRVTLYGPASTASFVWQAGRWFAEDRDEHSLGRVPVVAIPNRVRGSRELGRSEITKAIRYYSDAAARTLLGLEVNREFYNAPQRIGLNVDDSMFEDESGNPLDAWSSIMGRVWNIPPNEEGMAEPKVQQFAPASPAPYLDQVQGYAQRVASEAGIPSTYFGIHTANPASADAIRAAESRLVKRAERRQGSFGRAWTEVGRLSLLVRDGRVPDAFDTSVSTKWRDAATPTRAASADEATKLVGSGILPPESSVTLDRVGLSPSEQRQIVADRRRAQGAGLLDGLPELPSEAQIEVEDAKAVSAKAEALGQLIRSGVDPESAAAVLGMSGLRFTGATPVTLRLPESQAAELEEK